MKSTIIRYQLVPADSLNSDSTFPILSSISFNLTTSNGQFLEFKASQPFANAIPLLLKGEGIIPTELHNIVSIESPTEPTHQKSNNKIVFFTHRSPGILVDFTSSRHIQQKLHITDNDMVEVYRGIYVNKLYIKKFDGKFLYVETFGGDTLHKIPVSRTHKNIVLNIIKSSH